ncbi:SUMF1/EgtB/PvdO family nonheme iron enzyme [Thermodesulfobacteriota bacterium]
MNRQKFGYGIALLVFGFFYVVLGGQSNVCIDDDGDGYSVSTCGSECGPVDCDDTNPDVNPGAFEGPGGDSTCSDGHDNDCDGAIDVDDLGCFGSEMTSIPAGEFIMGSDPGEGHADEEPEHVVTLSAYDIDVYEVTNAEFAEFLNAYGSNNSPEGLEMLDADDMDRHIFFDVDSWVAEAGYEDHPVIEVTWYGANTFCEYFGKRLPTEAEWEKAARGGCEVGGDPGDCEDPDDERTYPWGEGIDCGRANYSGCVEDTMPVGSYPDGVSPYGVHDMAGNVWEWVADKYHSGYYSISPPEDPTGPVTGLYRNLRGGSWAVTTTILRIANRNYSSPVDSNFNDGFRCAR